MNQMQIATKSRLSRNDTKLLHLGIDKLNHHKIIDLPKLIPENSLLVVNNASTLPASFHGYVGSLPVELRLVQNHVQQISDIRNWFALVFYKGSW